MNSGSEIVNQIPDPSVMRPTLLYFWLACHAALDAASSKCFPGFLLEFIPLKTGAAMTIIVKGFMTHYTSPWILDVNIKHPETATKN